MAGPGPQLEDGFTRIANELLEQTVRHRFNGTQFRIILTIWRYTYGFSRKESEFSLSFLVEATGLNRRSVERELDELIEKKVIMVVTEATGRRSRILKVNKHYEEWETVESVNSQTQRRVGQLTDPESVNSQTQTSRRVGQLTDQERKSFKESIKERIICMDSIPFKEIIDHLNKKAGKRFSHKSEPTRKLISGRFSEGRTLEDFIFVIDTKVAHWKDNPNMNQYLRPSTLFRPTNFENYLNQTANAGGGFDSDQFLDSLNDDGG